MSGSRPPKLNLAKVEAKPIEAIATCDGFRKGSTHPTSCWDGILAPQLDYRTRPCNFVEIMPRLDEHLRRPKAKGASV